MCVCIPADHSHLTRSVVYFYAYFAIFIALL